MRILHLTSARYMGGGERHVVDLVRGLHDTGHEVFVGSAPHAALLDALYFLQPERIAQFPFRGPIDYLSARAVAHFAKDRKIDVIHAHVARDYTIGAMASSRTGIPLVITRHVLFPMSRLHRLFLRNVRFVIAPSHAVAQSLHDQAIFAGEKIVTIRHGLSAEEYPVHDPVERDEFVVGSIGNLDPVKGFDVLIRAASEVLPQIPKARFVIAGVDRSPNGRHERELGSLIAQLGLKERVQLTGWSEDIRQTLAGFDLFVSASRSESFGYVIAEAMLSGVPVIATETEGAKEIVGKAEVGRLVPVEDPTALSDTIIELAGDAPKLRSMASVGRAHIETEFSFDRMIKETESLYAEMVSIRKAPV